MVLFFYFCICTLWYGNWIVKRYTVGPSLTNGNRVVMMIMAKLSFATIPLNRIMYIQATVYIYTFFFFFLKCCFLSQCYARNSTYKSVPHYSQHFYILSLQNIFSELFFFYVFVKSDFKLFGRINTKKKKNHKICNFQSSFMWALYGN